jgi:arylsulfatase A-like enzyme
MATRRPNILLITSDQQHYSTLGSINPRIRTPALDRLCSEGTRFDRAYCPNPTCTPTRASIVTGLYPSQHGAWSLGTKLPEHVPTVGDFLSRSGYRTSTIGKVHLQPLASTDRYSSLEAQPTLRDLDFWRGFHGPWYGFDHVETARMHANESHVGQHYAIWLEEKGLDDWEEYFQPWPPRGDAPRDKWDGRTWHLPEQLHYSVWTAERTIAQLEQAAEDEQPFFCWASFHDPHPAYLVPEPWASMYDPAEMEPGRLHPGEHQRNPIHFGLTQQDDAREQLYDRFFEDSNLHGFGCHRRSDEQIRRDMATYYGMISLMDREIGRILDTLDRLGQAGDTLVVFSTDHGHFLGQHGLTAKGPFHYEDMLRVPMVVRWPGRVEAGAVREAIQNLIDLPETFLAAAGLEVPGTMTGLNQLPTWTGGEPVRTGSITENRHSLQNVHLRTYVNRRYKITVYRSMDDGELFDLEEDPGEIRNLWDQPACQQLKADLLAEFLRATMACEPTPMPRIAPA